MLYSVMLDCRPTATIDFQPFFTIKFIETDDPEMAFGLAVVRTRALMSEKGFSESDIASFAFTLDEMEVVDPSDADLGAEQSLIFYEDD